MELRRGYSVEQVLGFFSNLFLYSLHLLSDRADHNPPSLRTRSPVLPRPQLLCEEHLAIPVPEALPFRAISPPTPGSPLPLPRAYTPPGPPAHNPAETQTFPKSSATPRVYPVSPPLNKCLRRRILPSPGTPPSLSPSVRPSPREPRRSPALDAYSPMNRRVRNRTASAAGGNQSHV